MPCNLYHSFRRIWRRGVARGTLSKFGSEKPDAGAKASIRPGFFAIQPNKAPFAAAIAVYLPRQTD